MESLVIEQTEDTPTVVLDRQISKFTISGKSFPEEARKFYDPIISWLNQYSTAPLAETVIELDLEYYNTATSTMLLEMFYVLESIQGDCTVKIIWRYNEFDDDMLDAGKEYDDIIRIPFEFVAN